MSALGGNGDSPTVNMDVLNAIEPLLQASQLFGVSTFGHDLVPARKIRLTSWLILVANVFLQFADWYRFAVIETSGNLKVWIRRYPHDSPVIAFNCFCTTLIILFRDETLRSELARLLAFSKTRFPIHPEELRRLNRATKALINCCVGFCVVFITANGLWWWWWYMQHITSLLRYLLYCFGLFAHFISCSVISCQIVTYYLLIRLWYRAINEHIAGAREAIGNDLRRKIRVSVEADRLIKNFSDSLAAVYSLFLLLSCVVTLIECIHAAVFLVLTPEIETYEVIATVFFVATLLTQLCLFIFVSASAANEAEKIPSLVHALLAETQDAQLLGEMEIFSLQLLHRNIEFTALGFFKLDFSLLYGMVGTVTSYILILVQYESSRRRRRSHGQTEPNRLHPAA